MMPNRWTISVGLAVLLVVLTVAMAWSTMNGKDRQLATVTVFSTIAGPDESPTAARVLALFGATYAAVVQWSNQLAEAGLLDADVNRKTAIFCLVADGMPFQLLDQSVDEDSRTYTATIKGVLSLADYVKADIRNESLDKEEMEPEVPSAIAPAIELSRAYRYISHGHWRMAIIYMDHLETNYPYWGALHLAKATAYFGNHEEERALRALKSACNLGTQEACVRIPATIRSMR